MLKPKNKVNKRIKNKLLPEIEFKKLYYSEISKKDNSPKQNFSYLSIDENDENKNNISDCDLLSISNSSNKNNKKSPILQINKDNDNPFVVYEEIKSYIEKFINDYINEKTSIYFILKEIYNAIIIIIKDFIENNNSSLTENKQNLFVTGDVHTNIKNDKINSSNLELDINSKIVFLLTIQKLNEKIKKLQEEIEFFKNVIEVPKKKKYGHNFVDMFKKKYKEQKVKNKKEEYKYLLCIEEQEKKINTLENELKKKENENLPTETLKLVRCFPNFHQYDFKEDINPKSIPLFQQFQKEKMDKYTQKEILKTPKNFSETIKHKKVLLNNNNNSSNNRTKLFLTNSDFNDIKKNNSVTRKDNVLKINKSKNNNIALYNDNKIINNVLKIKKHIFSNDSNTINYNDGKEQKKLNEILKDYHPKTILDNKKEFFIAHPTLNIAGFVKKKEVKYVGLPKKLIRLKVHKSLEKDIMMTFPSSLNETLLNLEKLRKCKNTINVDNEHKS